MRADNEFNQNAGVKRGLVVERDPAKMRVKVNFDDEDETVSMWVDVLARSAGPVKTFMMPDQDDEVWCMIDAKGEDGCVVGSKYNDKDIPPSDDNAHITMTGPFGTFHVDGINLFVDIVGNIQLKAGGEIINISQLLTHNGKDVGHTHKHTEVMAGPSLSGVPV